MLNLVPHRPILVVSHLLLPIFNMILSFSLVNGLLDSLLEIYNFIINEVLVNFHFFFEIFHLAFVDQLKDSRASIFNCLYALFLELKDLSPDLSLKASMALVMYSLSLEVQELSFSLGKLKTLKVSIHK